MHSDPDPLTWQIRSPISYEIRLGTLMIEPWPSSAEAYLSNVCLLDRSEFTLNATSPDFYIRGGTGLDLKGRDHAALLLKAATSSC